MTTGDLVGETGPETINSDRWIKLLGRIACSRCGVQRFNHENLQTCVGRGKSHKLDPSVSKNVSNKRVVTHFGQASRRFPATTTLRQHSSLTKVHESGSAPNEPRSRATPTLSRTTRNLQRIHHRFTLMLLMLIRTPIRNILIMKINRQRRRSRPD